MNIQNAFPSDYLRASDLQGKQVKVTMSYVEMKEIGGDHKPILHFEGKEKGIVLNKTNMSAISAAYGDETTDWQGGEIILFEAMVDFQGKTVAAIRVKVPPRKPQPIAPAAAQGVDKFTPHPDATHVRSIVDDDIPF